MSSIQIPNLPSATGLNGSEQFEGVQSGTSVKITATQIATYISSAYPAPGISSVSGTAPIAASTVSGAVTVSLNSQGITNTFMAPMAAGTVKANVTGGSASPTDATVSQVLDVIGSTKGNILYRDTSSWAALTGGSNGQVLTAQGSTAVPIWTTLSVPSGQIAPTGVTAGTYGSASTVPQFTVLASGQISSATNVSITIPYTSVTGLGSIVTQNANNVAITGGTINGTTIGGVTPAPGTFTTLTSTGATNLGTISTGVWQGTPVAVAYGGTGATTAAGARSNLGAAASGANSDITSLSGLTTPLSGPQGGTGFGSYTTGDILYADTSSTLARLNDVATGNALISGGVGVAPSYGKIGLTTHVSGTLPVANGGTGATTLTGYVYGNGTGAFTAAATIPNAGLTNSSVTIGSTSIALGGTATTLAGLTTVTLTQDPTLALEASTKQYVDAQVATVSNQTFHTACYATTTANLTATYSNGTGGVGATLTNSGSLAAFSTDGQSPPINSRILVKNQTSGLQNGIYTLTTVGSGAIAWVLTRATDFDTVGSGPNQIETGAATFINNGNLYGASGWVMTTTGTLVVGTTSFTWTQTSSSSSVTVSSPLLKTGSDISLTTVPTTLGGTGLTTLTQYNVMLGNGTGNVAFAAPSTTGYPLLSTGASSNPAFGQLSLTAGVTGTLPVTNGGTGTSTAFTAGSVVFAGASGTYSQSNSELFWNNSSNFLGIGTGSPDAVLTVVSPTQTSVTAGTLPAGTDLHIVGADSAITRITQDSFGTGNYPAYTGRSSRGTAASPTASQAGDILSQYGGRGRGATDYSTTSVAHIDLEAAENFTDTAQGSYISFHTTALGAASPVERFRIGPSGQLGIGGATYGTSGYVLTSGGASAAPTWSQVSASSLSGVLPVANGGTNISSYTIGDLLYADGTTSLAKLADIATGNVLLSGGVGAAPSYGKVGLTTHVTGTLPIANGGTNLTSTPTDGQLLIGSTAGAGYSLATLTAGTAIGITNGAGAITINNNGVTSLTASTGISVSASTGGVTVTNTGVTSAIASTGISVSGATGAVTFTNTGVTSIVAGTNITVSGATGAVTVNTSTSPTFSGGITNGGNETFTGTGARILGDFSNATFTNRLSFQSSTTNGNTGILALPNGSATTASWQATNNADPTNCSKILITANGSTDVQLVSGTNGSGTYLPLSFWTNNSERMRIDTSGNVGIGTASPQALIDAYSTGNTTLRLSGSSGGGGSVSQIDFFRIGSNVTSSIVAIRDGGNTSGALTFYTASSGTNTERMRIDSSGNVGIGTSSPGGALSVYRATGTAQWAIQTFNNANTSGSGFWQRANGSHEMVLRDASNNANYITNQSNDLEFVTNGSERVRISSTGGFSVGTTSDPGAGAIYATGNITAYFSDDRLKVRKGNIENALAKVEAISGFHYEANETAQALGYKAKPEVGVSAQEVQAILPEVVVPAPVDDQYLTVHYERLVPLLIEAVKELSARVKELEAK
jgi:hypothetical protein